MLDFEPLKDGDLETIARQLGRCPRDVLGVAYRCRFGRPAVIVNSPLVAGDGRAAVLGGGVGSGGGGGGGSCGSGAGGGVGGGTGAGSSAGGGVDGGFGAGAGSSAGGGSGRGAGGSSGRGANGGSGGGSGGGSDHGTGGSCGSSRAEGSCGSSKGGSRSGCEAWTPLPTVLWLTCPYLVAAVGELESRGLVRQFTEEIGRRAEVAAGLEQAHRQYAAFRQELILLLPQKAWDYLAAHPAIREVLIHSGVGGARDYTSLKCLHMHLAHYLAGGDNPAGRMVAAYLAREGIDLAGDPSCRAEKSSTGSTE